MTTLADNPPWLAKWHATHPPRPAPPAAAAQPRKATVRPHSAPKPKSAPKQAPAPRAAPPTPPPITKYSQGFDEPKPWDWDGGKRREPVLDLDYNPPRVVRKVGWRVCMSCTAPFWSQDVIALRICTVCKNYRPPGTLDGRRP